jgi:hypothetical protein
LYYLHIEGRGDKHPAQLATLSTDEFDTRDAGLNVSVLCTDVTGAKPSLKLENYYTPPPNHPFGHGTVPLYHGVLCMDNVEHYSKNRTFEVD